MKNHLYIRSSWRKAWVTFGTIIGEVLITFAQVAQPIGSPSTDLQIAEVGPNYRICEDPNASTQATQLGSVASNVASKPAAPRHRVELATGMNYYNPVTGAWEPSQPEFSLSTDSSAFVANKVQHKVRLNADIYAQGAVTIDFQGMELQSTPAAIGIYDALDGSSAIIATLTNSTGVQISSNTVLFSDAFSGACGSIAYTIQAGAIHQDVIFTDKLDPTDYGFSTNDPLRIQVFTEFFGQVPEPDLLVQPVYIEVDEAVRKQLKAPDLMDTTIGFGDFVFGTGRAFTTPTPNDPGGTGVVVAKDFVTTSDGRNFLVETVDFKFVQQLLSLPNCSPPGGSARVIRKGETNGLYASIPLPLKATDRKLVAKTAGTRLPQVSNRPAGVVIDYIGNVGGTLTNTYVFAADTNFFVNGAVYCNGPAVFEAAVFKYPTNSAFIQLNSTVTFKTSAYRPCIFTAVDDDSVGDSFTNWPQSNYKGTINPNGYANPAIYMNETALTLSNCRFCYAQQAIRYVSPSPSTSATLTVNHSQFVNCIRGIELDTAGTAPGTGVIAVNLNNSLLAGVPNPVIGSNPGNLVNFAFVHCTIDQATKVIGGTWGNTVKLSSTNSIYANVTNATSGVTLAGNNNGFFNASGFGTTQVTATNSPFQQIGAGKYYLANGSSFILAGSSNIPPSLAADIQQRTVFPPTVMASQLVTTDLSLIPQASRDNGPLPSIGYHYPSLDYACAMVNVTNSATITINPGTVIGGFAFPSNKLYSINFGSGAKLYSEGVPTNMVRVVSYNLVQEQATNGWSEPATNGLITDAAAAAAAGGFYIRFTDLASPTTDVNLLNLGTAVAEVQDCQLHGGYLTAIGATMNLTNNLLERVFSNLESSDGQIPVVRNNTFYQGTLELFPLLVTNTIVKDNLFDQTSMYYSLSSIGYAGGHNAFVTNCSKYNCCILYPTNTSDLLLSNSPSYQTSWFSSYYLPAGSQLIDAGSTNANYVGLYQYTTQTNQIKETNSIVDIGWHGVATDTNGVPLSTGGNGLPDWFADQNGDGVYDTLGPDSYGVPYGWYLLHGLYPLLSTVPTQDPDFDALLNYQEYRFGTDPEVSQGVGIWVASPNGLTSAP